MKSHEAAESIFLSQIDQLSVQAPDMAFVGSIGRAGITGEQIGAYRPTGKLRDIDVLDTGAGAYDLTGLSSAAMQPHRVDTIFRNWIQFEGDEVHLTSPFDAEVRVPVHPDVFAPEAARVGDVPISVLNPRTQQHIDRMMGPLRPKDVPKVKQFETAVQGRTDLLPNELFEPFRTLDAAIGAHFAEERRLASRFAFVPDRLRYMVQPIAQPLLHRYVRYIDRRKHEV